MGFPGGTVDLPGPPQPELAEVIATAHVDPYGHGERLVAALLGLVPVAPGLLAPSGVLTVGAALVLRDVVQRCLGLSWGLAAIAAGTVLSALVAPAALVLASGTAFALSEIEVYEK